MKFLSYQTKIVVYLTYEEYEGDKEFSYSLNNELVAKTNKPDYVFDNLLPDTEYVIKVATIDKIIDEIKFRTAKEKETIYVDIKGNNGQKLVTKQVQKYLDLANEHNQIVFKAGTYLVGALFVKSNSEIVLEKGALILGSSDLKNYLPKIPSRFEGHEMECYASLINIGEMNHNASYTTHNVIIRGEGEIRGGGNPLREAIINEELKHIESSLKNNKDIGIVSIVGRKRNRLINISNAQNVIIDGLSLGYSASWNLHYIYSNKVYIHHCSFTSYGIHNGDGIDPDSSSESDIFANTFDVGDDCIAIKSGKNPEGNEINIPSKDISIFDCVAKKGHGLSIGSELSGGISNIYAYDIDFAKTLYGLHIKTTRKRGGYAKNIFVKNCIFPSINIRTVTYNDDGVANNHLTVFENFHFSHITLTGIMFLEEDKTDDTLAIHIEGFEEEETFKNFYIDNMYVMNCNNNREVQKVNYVKTLIFSNIFYKEVKYEY